MLILITPERVVSVSSDFTISLLLMLSYSSRTRTRWGMTYSATALMFFRDQEIFTPEIGMGLCGIDESQSAPGGKTGGKVTGCCGLLQ